MPKVERSLKPQMNRTVQLNSRVEQVRNRNFDPVYGSRPVHRFPFDLLTVRGSVYFPTTLSFDKVHWAVFNIVHFFFFLFFQNAGPSIDGLEESWKYLLHELDPAVHVQNYNTDSVLHRWYIPVSGP